MIVITQKEKMEAGTKKILPCKYKENIFYEWEVVSVVKDSKENLYKHNLQKTKRKPIHKEDL